MFYKMSYTIKYVQFNSTSTESFSKILAVFCSVHDNLWVYSPPGPDTSLLDKLLTFLNLHVFLHLWNHSVLLKDFDNEGVILWCQKSKETRCHVIELINSYEWPVPGDIFGGLKIIRGDIIKFYFIFLLDLPVLDNQRWNYNLIKNKICIKSYNWNSFRVCKNCYVWNNSEIVDYEISCMICYWVCMTTCIYVWFKNDKSGCNITTI